MQKVIVIVGPTGVGKTSLSVALAKKYNGEVISGDSMQIYKEMSIGTAKVTKEEMQDIPHHLIDERSYKEEYNVKQFQELARERINDIIKRGKLPIICGGTGLYIKSLLYDYRFVDQEKDDLFEEFLSKRSNSELYAMLRIVDADATNTIHPNNRQRITRALSMAHLGEKKSEIVASQEHSLLYDVYPIGLTIERDKLYERINERVLKMMDHGLLDEIKHITSDDSVWNLQSMQGIGYKEWKEYMQGEMTLADCISLIQKNSRNFAKKQYTWFHNQMPVNWYDIEKEDWESQLHHNLENWKLDKCSN